MHILTKVFVVFAAVLSLLLSTMTVMYASNAERVRAAYERSDLQRLSAEAARTMEADLHGNERIELLARLSEAGRQLTAERTRIGDLETRLARALQDALEAQKQAELARGRIDQFGVVAQTQAELLTRLRDENSSLRESEVEYNEQRLALEDTVAELRSNNQVLEDNNRALQEQIADRQRAGGSRLAAGGSSGATVATVSGTVTNVSEERETGDTMVAINQGRSSGLAEGTELTVSRGSDYIATIRIDTVDLRASVGRVKTRGGGGEVRVGDRVSTFGG